MNLLVDVEVDVEVDVVIVPLPLMVPLEFSLALFSDCDPVAWVNFSWGSSPVVSFSTPKICATLPRLRCQALRRD